MKKTFAVWMMAALAATAIGTTAAAQGPGFGQGYGQSYGQGFGEHRAPMERALGPQGDHGRWWNNPETIEKLKLTDEQRKAMDGILQEHRIKLIDVRAGLEKVELELEPLMKADQPDEAKIIAQIDRVAQSRAELEKANARFLLALRSKISAEQWKQLQELRSDARERFGAKMQRQPGEMRQKRMQREDRPPMQPQAAPQPPAGSGNEQ